MLEGITTVHYEEDPSVAKEFFGHVARYCLRVLHSSTSIRMEASQLVNGYTLGELAASKICLGDMSGKGLPWCTRQRGEQRVFGRGLRASGSIEQYTTLVRYTSAAKTLRSSVSNKTLI
jgi:hypothetical protein